MTRYIFLIGSLLCALIAPALPLARAQDASIWEGPCTNAYRNALAREERFFRTVIYGQRPADKARTGTVQYDTGGNAWIKIGPDTWKSPSSRQEQATWNDASMDAYAELPNRVGLVEIRKALTSETFIEPATQSLRALRCRMEAQCLAAAESPYTFNNTVTVQALGCIPMNIATMPECRPENALTQRPEVVSAGAECMKDARATLLLEADLLRMTAAYDAGYRSLLQFAGAYEEFLDDMRDPVIEPMRRAVEMFLQLQRIPCFTTECRG